MQIKKAPDFSEAFNVYHLVSLYFIKRLYQVSRNKYTINIP